MSDAANPGQGRGQQSGLSSISTAVTGELRPSSAMSHRSVGGAGNGSGSMATIADVPPSLLRHIVSLAKVGQLDGVLDDVQPPPEDYEGMGSHLQQSLSHGTGPPPRNSSMPMAASPSSPPPRSSPAPVSVFTRSHSQDVRSFGQPRAQLQISTSHSLHRGVRGDRPSPLSSVASPYMETASEIGSSTGLTGAAMSDAASSSFIDDDNSDLGDANEWNTTVFVGGLSSSVTEDDLFTHFVGFGRIHYVSL